MAAKWKPKKPPPPHVWVVYGRVVHWPRCAHCGLVRLNNKRTESAVRAPCPSDD